MVLDAADHDTWSCGSFFTNPVMSAGSYAGLLSRVRSRPGSADGAALPPRFDAPDGQVKTSAAWLIDKAGFSRGYGKPGPATLSTKHVLAVTNRGSATAAQVVALAREIRDGVHDAFGVSLVNEPVLVGTSL
jgi:UDP-N-acetylmuramate dehydrogenase